MNVVVARDGFPAQGLLKALFEDSQASILAYCPEELSLFDYRALNLHPGRLPEFAGLHVHQWAIREGLSETEGTIHFMVDGLDSGGVVDALPVPIDTSDTGLSLFQKLMVAGSEAIKHVL